MGLFLNEVPTAEVNLSARFADNADTKSYQTPRHKWRYCVYNTEAAHAYVASTPLPGLPAEGEEPVDAGVKEDDEIPA
jgi:hypothetical protein